jgi:hypothetical protein
MPSRRATVTTALSGVCAVGTSAGRLPVESKLSGASPRRLILVFDVNETMLDINGLELHLARAFGNGQVVRELFSTLYVAEQLAVGIGDLCMGAAYTWDGVGRFRQAAPAHSSRDRERCCISWTRPDIIASDFRALAEQTTARDSARKRAQETRLDASIQD